MSRFDVAIVGAGIIGSSCAYQLSDAGLHCVVLERELSAGMGSTARSCAGVRVQFGEEATNILLSLATIRELRSFEDRFGVDSGYRPVGYLYLLPPELWDERLRAVELQRSLGALVEVLSIDEARARFLDFDPTGLAGATFGSADGFFDPHTVTQAYLAAARRRGCEVRVGQEVTGIAQLDDGDWELAGGGDRVRAGTVLNAAGCWSGQVARLAGLEVPVQPYRRSIFATAPRPERAMVPNVVDATTWVWFRSEGPRLLLGKWSDVHVLGFLEGIDWGWLDRIVEAMELRFPWFEEEGLDAKACWWGYYEMTPDENAIVGASPDATGWVNACGFSGHGVMHGPAIGLVIREEIVDGRAHTINVDALRIERFPARSWPVEIPAWHGVVPEPLGRDRCAPSS